MTGYCAELFVNVFSFGTGPTCTLMCVGVANGGCSVMWNVIVWVEPTSMRLIVPRFTIGVGVFWIVSVTGTWTSCAWPVSFTDTSKARFTEAVIVVSLVGESCSPPGRTFVATRPTPWTTFGLLVRDVVAPWIRCQIGIIERVLARSGLTITLES